MDITILRYSPVSLQLIRQPVIAVEKYFGRLTNIVKDGNPIRFEVSVSRDLYDADTVAPHHGKTYASASLPVSLYSSPTCAVTSWIDSDRYTIDATLATPQKPAMMQRPMLQALLEDPFGLRIHRGT